jgi:ubiquinone biosynthesis protein COQ4
MRERPSVADVDLDALRRMPASTLGGAFARFLDDNHLSMDFYDIVPERTEDPDKAYLLMRHRHVHDIWHVLAGFGTEGHNEVLIHAFTLAQSGMLGSVGIVALGAVKHMLLEGRFGLIRSGLLAAYRRGRAAEPLLPVYWERHWEESVDSLRAKYGIRPWTADDVRASAPFRWDGPNAAVA